jgi:hypothetical protein
MLQLKAGILEFGIGKFWRGIFLEMLSFILPFPQLFVLPEWSSDINK